MRTPEAPVHERTLSHDAAPVVAKFASRKLKHRGQEDPYNAWPFERQIQRASQ